MERRTFLGAAAALAALPADVAATDTEEDAGDVTGAREPVRSSYEGVWSATELFIGGTDDDTDLSVTGYHLPDEPDQCGVEIVVTNRSAKFHVDLPADRAREVAEDLERAADFAERGVKD